MRVDNLVINFLGDSITEGYLLDNLNDLYLEVLKKELNLKEARNYGISATTIARPLENLPFLFPEVKDLSFVDRFLKMDDKCDLVVVFGGTNDYGHGNNLFGNLNDLNPTTFYGALNYLFKGLKEKYPDKTIIIMTPLEREFSYLLNKVTNKPLEAYVKAIKEVSIKYDLKVLDLFNLFKKEELKTYLIDGLHPNKLGHLKIALKLKEFILNL